MSGQVFSERTRLTVTVGFAVACLLASARMVQVAYEFRDQAVAVVRTDIDRALADEGKARERELRGYLTIDEFRKWQLTESAKRDAQYFTLLGELRAIRAARGR